MRVVFLVSRSKRNASALEFWPLGSSAFVSHQNRSVSPDSATLMPRMLPQIANLWRPVALLPIILFVPRLLATARPCAWDAQQLLSRQGDLGFHGRRVTCPGRTGSVPAYAL